MALSIRRTVTGFVALLTVVCGGIAVAGVATAPVSHSSVVAGGSVPPPHSDDNTIWG